jgi:hypothetical protein
MTERYSTMVKAVVIDADVRAGARAGGKLNKGVALAMLLEAEGFPYQPTAIRSWMRGDTRPPVDAFLAVASGTGISIDEVLQTTGQDAEGLTERVGHQADAIEDLRSQVERLTQVLEAVPELQETIRTQGELIKRMGKQLLAKDPAKPGGTRTGAAPRMSGP